jgi:phytoene desaturase
MEPHLLQTAIFRPHNRSEDVEGLYFVGAGTHPGAGLPVVLLTAEVTEKVVLEDLKYADQPVTMVYS